MSGARPAARRSLLLLAAAAEMWERWWPALWPVVAIAGLFFAIACLDVLPSLPGSLHALIVAGFAGAAGLALWRAVRRFPQLHRAAARHRVERDSGLTHRPLTALEDRLAGGSGDPVAEALWRQHQEQARRAARHLRVRWPTSSLSRHDPRVLRTLVVLAVIIGLVAAGDDLGPRLGRAFAPLRTVAAGGNETAIDVWITPPVHTAVPPMVRRAPSSTADTEPLAVPAGSAVLALARGLAMAPELHAGEERVSFDTMPAANAPATFQARGVLRSGHRLAVAAGGRELAGWPVTVVADNPPTVLFAVPVAATADGSITVRYLAEDDYGVESVAVVVQGPPDLGDSGNLRLSLPLSALAARSVGGGGSHDLTAHPWAGSPVTLTLEARDFAGQTGTSGSVAFTLPERIFAHPVAQAIVSERKRLVSDTVAVRQGVAEALSAIASVPQRFANDVVVSLALAVAEGRLRHDRAPTALASVWSVLWDTALRLERGTVPSAERALQEARQRLYDALRSDADDATIERLVDDLRKALDDYLAAVAAEVARMAESGDAAPPMGDVVRGEDLQELVELTRQLARSGARDSARQLLTELQRVIDAVRSGLADTGAARQMVEANKMLKALRDLTGRQQGLLDRTFERLREKSDRRERGEGGTPQRAPREGAEEQEALRRELGDLMKQADELLGGIPPHLGQAERAMQGAGESLAGGQLRQALDRQGRAVELLREATEAAAAMIARRFGGVGAGDDDSEGDGQGSDPFGRFGGDGHRGLGTGDVRVPGAAQMRRVDEILRELRRRAGESDRPAAELEYIRRLLRRF